jgi:antitoxin ParD1/3/4
MTSTGKIAVSLPLPQIDAAKQAVREGRAASVSSYVSEALARRQQDDALADLVAEWMVEDGAPSSDDYAWADAVLADAEADGPRRRPTHA